MVGNGGREQVARASAAQHRSNRLDLAWPNDDARDFSWVHRGAALPASAGGCDVVTTDTWLILPVVICLSQRLSHACLSVNTSTL